MPPNAKQSPPSRPCHHPHRMSPGGSNTSTEPLQIAKTSEPAPPAPRLCSRTAPSHGYIQFPRNLPSKAAAEFWGVGDRGRLGAGPAAGVLGWCARLGCGTASMFTIEGRQYGIAAQVALALGAHGRGPARNKADPRPCAPSGAVPEAHHRLRQHAHHGPRQQQSQYATRAEIAAAHGPDVTEEAVRNWWRRGNLLGIKVGRTVYHD